MVHFGSGQGLNFFAATGIVLLFQGLQKSENAAPGRKMPFLNGHWIEIFLVQDGLIAVLKQMPASAVTAVETNGIAGQQTLHDRGHRHTIGFEQQMEMIRNQHPSIPLGLCFDNQISQPFHKIVAVLVVKEYFAPLDSPGNDMVYRTRCVYSGLSWHAPSISRTEWHVNVKI